MDKTMLITLAGDAHAYRLEMAAGDRLERYLERAAAGLRDDPDRAEILADLERSVGDKLAARGGHGDDPGDRLVTVADIDAVLEEIGAVDTGRGAPPASPPAAARAPRRLRRIRSEQELAGVCAGLAAYAELPTDWVRWFFALATLFSAGLFGLVYVALVFVMPVVETRDS
jgi:phage shock protein PspC (stress-responsive transcriptional regulator)